MTAHERPSDRRRPSTRGRQVPRKRALPVGRILLGSAVGAVVLIGALIWFGTRPSGPVAATSPGGPVPTMTSADHVADGTRVEYSTNPPTSGAMWNGQATWGVYPGNPPADELLMHNLEHGGVIISYNPAKVDAPTVEQLRQLTRELRSGIKKCLILTPRASIQDDKPIALTSWGVLATLDAYDAPAIRAFWRDNANNGPEKGMGC